MAGLHCYGEGFFAENGVSVELVAAQSAAAATMQAAAGSAQMSVGGMTGVMFLVSTMAQS